MTKIRERRRLQIVQSFRQLLFQEPLEKISIEEICQEAQIHRSTFYRYFQDKDDLFRFLFETYFVEQLDNTNLVTSVIHLILREKKIFRNISINNQRSFAYWLMIDIVAARLEEAAESGELAQAPELCVLATMITGSTQPALTAKMIAGAFLVLLFEWIDSNYQMTAQEVEDLVKSLFNANFKSTTPL